MTEVRDVTRRAEIFARSRDQFLGHAIGEVLLLRIARQVRQRQDGDRLDPTRRLRGGFADSEYQRGPEQSDRHGRQEEGRYAVRPLTAPAQLSKSPSRETP